jgi:hypothetical protein
MSSNKPPAVPPELWTRQIRRLTQSKRLLGGIEWVATYSLEINDDGAIVGRALVPPTHVSVLGDVLDPQEVRVSGVSSPSAGLDADHPVSVTLRADAPTVG